MTTQRYTARDLEDINDGRMPRDYENSTSPKLVQPGWRSDGSSPSEPTKSRDTEILNQIEDFMVNNFGEDDEPLSATEAVEMLVHISGLLDTRKNS